MKKFYEYLCKIEVFLVQAFLIVMTILVFIAGVSRMIHRPIYWANPLASFFFAWAAFLATDAAFRENRLMSIDFIVNRFSERVRIYVRLFNYLVILAFCVFLIIFGIRAAYIMRYRQYEGMYGFSYTWVTLSVPVGGFLISITTILKIVEGIKELRKKKS